MFNKYLTVRLCTIASAAAALLLVSTASSAGQEFDPKAAMKQQLLMMSPQLRERVMALSPETKKALMGIYAQHSRHSGALTLRQVMHEVLSDYEGIATAIMTDNREEAAAAARRLANHRIPRGGLLPYMKLEDVTDERLAVLIPFNDAVEGNARRLADAAEAGDMAKATEYFGSIASGCVACHNVFRGQPGVSRHLQ